MDSGPPELLDDQFTKFQKTLGYHFDDEQKVYPGKFVTHEGDMGTETGWKFMWLEETGGLIPNLELRAWIVGCTRCSSATPGVPTAAPPGLQCIGRPTKA
jgi:hypothetical protein